MTQSSSNGRPAGAAGLDFIESVGSVVTDLVELAQSLPVPNGQSERTAKTLDRLAEELAESAAMLRALPGQPREAAGYTYAAAAAVTTAAQQEHDFAGWLAAILCQAAAVLGSSAQLVMGRSGSWEAELKNQGNAGTTRTPARRATRRATRRSATTRRMCCRFGSE